MQQRLHFNTISRLRLWPVLLLCCGLLACGGNTPSKPDHRVTPPTTSPPSNLLDRARQTTNLQQKKLLLLSILASATEEANWQDLSEALSELQSLPLTPDENQERTFYQAVLFNQTGAFTEASNLLNTLTGTRNIPASDITEQRIISAKGSGHYIEAASLLLQKANPTANTDEIWNLLNTSSLLEITHCSQSPSQAAFNWCQLNSIYRDNTASLDHQVQFIQRWAQDNPSQQLPTELKQLQKFAEQRPNNMVLLIPATGPLSNYGKAIRDGFLAALMRQYQDTSYRPTVTILDTHRFDDTKLVELLRQAKPELIVGPFDKARIDTISAQLAPTPVLALNYSTNQQANLYQFGLNPDDEARQIADRAILEAGPQGLLLYPNTDWGLRLGVALSEQLETYGGEIVSQASFNDSSDISSAVESALGIDSSKQRRRQLQIDTGLNLEFEPRRRADIDFITMFARPAQARTLKPLFAFHYAEDLPVYASSIIYSGLPDPVKDNDLDGTLFVEMPTILDNTQANNDRLSPAEIRLYALGHDAFKLYPRLQQLKQYPRSRVYGMTGLMRLNQSQQVERELDWAEFKRGRPVKIASDSPGER